MSNRFCSFLGFTMLALMFILQSCGYKHRHLMFKTKKEIKTKEAVLVVNPGDTTKSIYRHRIKVGDRLQLRFLNNFDIGGSAGKSATASAEDETGYLVNYDSTVILPLLGRINMVGLTRLEASKRLEKEYSKFVVDPIIDLNIASLRVTVLGEVTTQGKVVLDRENTNLTEVLALSGGIKETGKKQKIKIIRGNELIIVDLRQIESLQSQELVMHDGDIVYVEPYDVKASSEPSVAITPALTLIITGLSSILLITNTILLYRNL